MKNKLDQYTIHKIKKSNGKLRTIYDPSPTLRTFQYLALTKIFNQVTTPDYLWAFEQGRSIPQMAAKHINKQVVLSYDVKNYFESIHSDLLLKLFEGMGITDKAAWMLAQVCTYKYFLPQGALTSPKLSNLITMVSFGPSIKMFCDEKKYTLTIYADDITISSDKILTPEEIAEIGSVVHTALSQYGFRVNNKKTKVMSYARRQWVCGCVVNEKVNLLREDRLKLRAIIHNLSKNGFDSEVEKYGSDSISRFISEIRGKLNWYNQLNPTQAERLILKFNECVKAYEESVVTTKAA